MDDINGNVDDETGGEGKRRRSLVHRVNCQSRRREDQREAIQCNGAHREKDSSLRATRGNVVNVVHNHGQCQQKQRHERDEKQDGTNRCSPPTLSSLSILSMPRESPERHRNDDQKDRYRPAHYRGRCEFWFKSSSQERTDGPDNYQRAQRERAATTLPEISNHHDQKNRQQSP